MRANINVDFDNKPKIFLKAAITEAKWELLLITLTYTHTHYKYGVSLQNSLITPE